MEKDMLENLSAAAAQIGKRGEKWDFSMCCIKKIEKCIHIMLYLEQ